MKLTAEPLSRRCCYCSNCKPQRELRQRQVHSSVEPCGEVAIFWPNAVRMRPIVVSSWGSTSTLPSPLTQCCPCGRSPSTIEVSQGVHSERFTRTPSHSCRHTSAALVHGHDVAASSHVPKPVIRRIRPVSKKYRWNATAGFITRAP